MDSRELVAPEGVPVPYTARDLRVLPRLDDLTERPIVVDQTNRSVIVGERLVVKWFTPPAPPPHRALRLMEQLAAAGFGDTAPLHRVVFDADGALVALVTGCLAGAADGWNWCYDAALAGRPVGAVLGAITLDLHRALATPTAVIPEPLVTGRISRLPAALATLEEALALTDDPWLHSCADRIRADLDELGGTVETPLMPIHGDLHVGQVLKWRDGYAVIDFDGNPTVEDGGDRRPAAQDVAQILMSVEHVGRIAQKRGHDVAAWVRTARADFLAAYGSPEFLERSLLRPLEIEQECRELIYAARSLPRWRYAPLGVLRSWYEEPAGQTMSAVNSSQ